MTRLLCDHWGNPSSVHDLGIEAERELKSARKAVVNALGAEPDRVFFTSGGTEANNLAIFGAAAAKARGVKFGRRPKNRPADYEIIKKAWCEGSLSARAASQQLGVTHRTFMKWIGQDNSKC